MPIILGSTSPRRVEILYALQIPFLQVESPADESQVTLDRYPDPREMCRYKAALKARALQSAYYNDVIIGSDTVVIFEGRLYEKPRDEEEVKRFMRSFSEHTVTAVSAVCVIKNGVERIESDDCDVTMGTITEREIQWYADQGDWRGKAGGFGIQAVAGRFVERVSGDYFVAVGLPVFKLCQILRELGEL